MESVGAHVSQPVTIRADSLGAAWLEVARQVLDEGRPGSYDGLPMRELILTTLEVSATPTRGTRSSPGSPIRSDWRGCMRTSPSTPG